MTISITLGPRNCRSKWTIGYEHGKYSRDTWEKRDGERERNTARADETWGTQAYLFLARKEVRPAKDRPLDAYSTR